MNRQQLLKFHPMILESICNDAYNTLPDTMALLCTSFRCSVMYTNNRPLPSEYIKPFLLSLFLHVVQTGN